MKKGIHGNGESSLELNMKFPAPENIDALLSPLLRKNPSYKGPNPDQSQSREIRESELVEKAGQVQWAQILGSQQQYRWIP